MRADNVPYSKIREIKHFCPDVVCILLGGNDISDMSSPCGFFRHIAKVVDEIEKVCDPKIYVCELLPRGKFKFSKDLTYERYEAQRKKINKKLRSPHHASVISLGKIKYPKDYISDLVQLNESGQKKFAQSYYQRSS